MLSLTRALAARQDKIRNNDKGFTLIELLVVVIIIGILAAIAIPIFLGQQASARDSAVASAVTNAKTAVVAELVEGIALGVIDIEALPSYTPSDDVTVTMTTSGDTFVITGNWDGIADTHEHTITEKTAAVKTTP